MIILTGCENTSKKDEKSAKENFKKAGEDLKKEEESTTIKENWEKFKSESATAIENTNIQIKELRDKIDPGGQKENERLTKVLDSLELKNKRLKDELAQREHSFKENILEFNEWAKEKQHKFENEFKRDLKEIEKALKKIVTPTEGVEDEF